MSSDEQPAGAPASSRGAPPGSALPPGAPSLPNQRVPESMMVRYRWLVYRWYEVRARKTSWYVTDDLESSESLAGKPPQALPPNNVPSSGEMAKCSWIGGTSCGDQDKGPSSV